MVNKKVIVIGAGAAGMMAAINAAKSGAEVTLFEKNNLVGRKIRITGKGRCNITNNCNVQNFILNVPTNGKFLYSALNAFTPQDTMNFFENLGLGLKIERGDRVFPVSDNANEVANVLNSELKKFNCKILNDEVRGILVKDGRCIGVKIQSSGQILADAVIVATGGASYKRTGSTGDGYKFAKSAGHTIISIKPSLVSLVSNQNFCSEMQGLSLKNVAIKIIDKDDNKIVYSDFGEMLFTHFGVTGPIILSASAHMKNIKADKYKLVIDLKPALSDEQLNRRLQRDFDLYANKDFSNSLKNLLPKKMIPVVIEFCGISGNTKCNQITKEARQSLAKLLKNFTITINGFRPIEEAIVTSGGVSVKELNPKTMESKLVQNLYFAGEVIDVDAYTGGYNLQIAFSTGFLAGQAAALKKEQKYDINCN